MMDRPHQFYQSPGHRQHGTAFRKIRPWAEDALELPLHRPPVVDIQRKVDEDDGIRGIKACRNVVPAAPTVDDPPVLREDRLVLLPDLFRGSCDPTPLPLDQVDGVQRQSDRLTETPTERALPASCVSNDGYICHKWDSLRVEMTALMFARSMTSPPCAWGVERLA